MSIVSDKEPDICIVLYNMWISCKKDMPSLSGSKCFRRLVLLCVLISFPIVLLDIMKQPIDTVCGNRRESQVYHENASVFLIFFGMPRKEKNIHRRFLIGHFLSDDWLLDWMFVRHDWCCLQKIVLHMICTTRDTMHD
jgi:hypothetical protein